MANDRFFDESTEASIKKHRIVSKYFGGWANIVLPQALKKEGRIMYVDLFCGPGLYKDGTRSTPLLILDHVIKTPALRDSVQLLLNDQNSEFVDTLEREVNQTPGVESLRYKPAFRRRVIDSTVIPRIESTKVPTLFFADPWGYKGISIDLIRAATLHWGSDFLCFFNYNRINMNLGCEAMNEPIEEFFGSERTHELRSAVGARLRPAEREKAILREMQKAIKGLGARVEKFTYRSPSGNRPTHHLLCVSKHRLGMSLFKEISAKESSRVDDNVPSLDHNPGANPDQDMLFSPLVVLEGELAVSYSGRVVTLDEIYHEHHNGKPYVRRNYRDALLHMEELGSVRINPPRATRGENFQERPKLLFQTHARRVPQYCDALLLKASSSEYR